MAKTAPAQDKLLALRTGERGETLALRWAMAQGWQLYGQRLRVGRCEVDLAMVREKPGQPRELLLIEVKASRRQSGDHALRWGKAQQARLWGAAEALMNQSNSQQVQVALVVVTLQADCEHVRWLIAEPF